MKISCLLRKIEFTSRYLLKSGPSIEDFNFCIFKEHLHHSFISQWNFFWELKSNPLPLPERCVLIESGAEVNKDDDRRWTLLHEATYRWHKEVIWLLIENGAEVKKADDFGWALLHGLQSWVTNKLLNSSLKVALKWIRLMIKGWHHYRARLKGFGQVWWTWGENIAFSCLQQAGERNFFLLIFTKPGRSLLAEPCTLNCRERSQRCCWNPHWKWHRSE